MKKYSGVSMGVLGIKPPPLFFEHQYGHNWKRYPKKVMTKKSPKKMNISPQTSPAN